MAVYITSDLTGVRKKAEENPMPKIQRPTAHEHGIMKSMSGKAVNGISVVVVHVDMNLSYQMKQ